MNTTSTLGHPVVPATTAESILDSLAQLAGCLEQLSWQAQAASSGEPALSALDAQTALRIRQALTATVEVGDEAFTVGEVTEAVAVMLAEDFGTPIPEPVIRSALPSLMLELFGAKLSCSIRRGDRYARGWRKIAPRTVELPTHPTVQASSPH